MTTRHPRKPRDRASANDHVMVCIPCGNKRGYQSRGAAKAAGRSTPGGGHMSSFPCPYVEPGAAPLYHSGHLPESVRNGSVAKSRYLNGKVPVRITVGDDMSVTVTFADPRDAARVCDALLVAAEQAHRQGRRSLSTRFVKIGHQLADAMDRTSLPPINATEDMARAETMA